MWRRRIVEHESPALVDVFPLVLEVAVVPLAETGIEDPRPTVSLDALTVPAWVGRLVDALVPTVGRETTTTRRGCVVDGAVQRVHAETQHVARFEIGGQPPVAVFLLRRDRIGVEPFEAVDVGVGIEVAVVQSLGTMAVLQHHEGALFTPDPAERDPTRHDAAGAAVHVRAVAVEATPLRGPHEARPPEVETPDRTAEQGLVDRKQLVGVGDRPVVVAGTHALGERTQVRVRDGVPLGGDGVVDRVTVVDLTENGVLGEDLVACRRDHGRVEEAAKEEVAVFGEGVTQGIGIAEQAGGVDEFPEPIGRGVEWMSVRGEVHGDVRVGSPKKVSGAAVGCGRERYDFPVPDDVRILPDVLALDDRGIPASAPALSDGVDSLDYEALDAAAGRLASALRQLGVEPGDRVAVHLRKSVWSFAAVHGVLRAGAVMVPIDPLAPVDHVSSVLRDASVHVLITDARVATVIAVAAEVPLTGVVLRGGGDVAGDLDPEGCTIVPWSALAAYEVASIADLGDVDPDDDAYIIYTSGSTGRPKGIVHTHRSALAYVRLAAAAYELASSDRLANIAGLHFDQSTFELYVAPFVGAAVTVVPDAVLRFPASVSELVERERVTVWYSVPYVLRQLVTRGALDTRDLTSIRWILYGGETYPPDELADLMRALPAATVSNVYGPAEVNQCMRHDLAAPPSPGRDVPIGRAWSDTELVVVDDDLNPLTDGPGELLVASTTMMDRYWNRPDLTAASMLKRTYPGASATRWYRTGDLVEADADGNLVFLGRADNQVKIRGQRIELEAIDTTIRQLDGVAEVAAVVRADESGERGVVAVIEEEPGSAVSLRELQRHVGSRHPRVAVPVDVVTVDALPRTGTGKVDRNSVLGHVLALGRR